MTQITTGQLIQALSLYPADMPIIAYHQGNHFPVNKGHVEKIGDSLEVSLLFDEDWRPEGYVRGNG